MGSRRAADHLFEQLKKFIHMDDFICVDVHSSASISPLSFTLNGITYKGGTDCVILPKNANKDQFIEQTRVIIELKLDKDNSGKKLSLHQFKVKIFLIS